MSYAFNGSPILPIYSAVVIYGQAATAAPSLTVQGDSGLNTVVLFQPNNLKGLFSVDAGAGVTILQGNSFGSTPALTVQGGPTFNANIVQWQNGLGQTVGQTDNVGQVFINPPVGVAGQAALTVEAGSANTSIQDWFSHFATQSDFRTSFFPHPPDLSVTLNGGLSVAPNGIGTAMSTTGDFNPLGFASVANAVASTKSLTSVAASVGGLAVYTGTITGGANNAFVNYSIAITGFTNPANNTVVGTNAPSPGHPFGVGYSFFVCVASTATTLTLMNANAVAETHAASAIVGSTVYTAPSIPIIFFIEGVSSYEATEVGTPINGLASYAWSLGSATTFVNYYVTFTGFVNASNNGTFLITANTATTVTVKNANAVAEAIVAVGPFALTSVATTAQSQTVYTGTITGGAANAYRGYVFNITGFTQSNNNGSWLCLDSTATTLTLMNANGLAETNPATANGSNAAATFWIEEAEFSLISANPFDAGQSVSVSGFTTATWLNGQTSVVISANVDDVAFTNVNPPALPYLALSSVATSTPLAGSPFSLTQAFNSAPYLGIVDATVYLGTITGGASNAYVGYLFTVTGFTNSGNNCTSTLCIASSATQIVLLNQNGVAETNPASAASSSAVYTGTITGGAANGLRGHTFTTSGFTNVGNNGSFFCVASTATTLTLGNDAAVVESASAVAGFSSTSDSGFGVAETGTVDSFIGTTNQWAGLWVTETNWSIGGSTNIDPNNGTFFALASTTTTLTLANPLGTAQTQYGTVAGVTNGSPLQEFFVFGNPFPVVVIGGDGTLSVGPQEGNLFPGVLPRFVVAGGAPVRIENNSLFTFADVLIADTTTDTTNAVSSSTVLAVSRNYNPSGTVTPNFLVNAIEAHVTTDPSNTQNMAGAFLTGVDASQFPLAAAHHGPWHGVDAPIYPTVPPTTTGTYDELKSFYGEILLGDGVNFNTTQNVTLAVGLNAGTHGWQTGGTYTGGTITDSWAVNIEGPRVPAGTAITHRYGIRMAQQSQNAGGTNNDAWAILSDDNDKSKFGTVYVDRHLGSNATNVDLTGTVTITNPATSQAVTFTHPFNSAPIVILTPTSDTTSAGPWWVSPISTTGFTANFHTTGFTVTFNYIVIGNPN